MLRRLIYALAAAAVALSFAASAAQTLATDIPDDLDTRPPGLAAGKPMDEIEFDLASGEPEDPTGKGIPG